MSVQDIINKRQLRWRERHDLDYDRQIVEYAIKKILSEERLRNEILSSPWLLIETAFYIVDKKRQTVPFILNDVQKDLLSRFVREGVKKPFFVLKGRQQGVTSFITAFQLAYSIVRKNFAGFTIADRADNTAAIFNDKARVVFDRLPDLLKPSIKFNSKNELFFDKLNSSWRIATATKDVGRSRTLNFVHFSEVAFFECDLSALQAGIGEALTADSIVVYETTANGYNQAKELWDSGACENVFYEWWRSAEYVSDEYGYLDEQDGWLNERLEVLKGLGLTKEQLTWYAKKYAGYIDKTLIRQEYPITPEEAFISSGDSVFDVEGVNNRLAELSNVKTFEKQGFFVYDRETIPVEVDGVVVGVDYALKNIQFIESSNGYIYIHSSPTARTAADGSVEKTPYTVGGDTAGTGLDYFAAKVISNIDGTTVATLHKQKIDEDLYAEQVLCLAFMYHDALIALEANYSRVPIKVISEKYRYHRLYVREKVDSISRETVEEYGFLTTTKTKPIIINELVALMRDNPRLECDRETLKEMLSFVKKENGKLEAISGEHDDLVMALAIAHFCSRQGVQEMIKEEPKQDTFLTDNFAFGGIDTEDDGISWEDL